MWKRYCRWPLVGLMLLCAACGEEEKKTVVPADKPEKQEVVVAPPAEAPPPPEVVRPAALAGRGWYPGDAETLAKAVDGFLEGDEWKGGPPRALIAPHAGYDWSGKMQGRVYRF